MNEELPPESEDLANELYIQLNNVIADFAERTEDRHSIIVAIAKLIGKIKIEAKISVKELLDEITTYLEKY
jgi:hypothetical protein